MYESQGPFNVSEDDPENWAVNSASIDADELLGSDDDSPGQVMTEVPTDESGHSEADSESDASIISVNLEELEEGDIVVDEQPVNASQDQGSGGIRLQHIGTYDLTQAMAGTTSCSHETGMSNKVSKKKRF